MTQDETDLRHTIRPSLLALRECAETITSLNLQPSWRITKAVIKPLRHFPKLQDLRLWSHCERTAISLAAQQPSLQRLAIHAMIGQQPLSGFANSQLEHLYIGSGSTSTDALEILQCVHLQYLSLHLAKLNAAFFSAASKHASLQTLNLEGAHFTEPMLKKLADAPHLKTLELPNTNIVPQALDVIAGLPQLLSLDLWHTAIPYEAYTVLAFAQSLQHISVGPEHFASRLTQEQQTKRVDLLIHQLSRINALQSVWLDGMLVTPTQQQQLETRFSKVRIDSPW